MIPVCLLPERIHPNAARVVVRHFPVPPESRSIDPAVDEKAWRIVNTIRAMDDRTIESELDALLADFENRHREVRQYFERRYDDIARDLDLPTPLRDAERALIGAYFCHEYSFEAAALMNPGIVPHPDQSDWRRASCASSCRSGPWAKGISRPSPSGRAYWGRTAP